MSDSRLQERPPAFTYSRSDGARSNSSRELLADAVPLRRLAERYGTPLYVYSATAIRWRYRQFDEAFSACEHSICYSVKANSNLSILRLLASLGAGFDIVSGGELHRVLAVSRKLAGRVVFSGVGKLADEIDLALRSGILLFNVESPSELQLLAARTTHLRKAAHFAVRVNPDVDAGTHPYISTGLHEHKFGVPMHEAPELYGQGTGHRYLHAAGVSVHIGSQILDIDPFREAMQRVASLVRTLRHAGHDIRYVDAGGGLGISYAKTPRRNFPARVKSYAAAIVRPLRRLGLHILLEPGRSIIGPAGVLLTRVIYRKRNDGKQFVIVDAAMNDLMRPSLYGAHHEIVPVLSGANSSALSKIDVVGPICESGDFFARNREMPDIAEGDLLAILDAGAYGMSLASNYNTRHRAAEVLVDGNTWKVIRRRESIGDLLAPERL
ncbi:MAG TPA: diaminopimelate decarboxylase [Candidatus Eisenbacteria bacterium]|nr:diaminopimelate decarboxylase [Candidatus Eisenbacteria bacterium]